MKKYMINRFILCGFTGWTLECLWTGLQAILKLSDKTLPCKTSVWMFPIYGMAALIFPVSTYLEKKSVLLRGVIYTFMIFLVEFTTGLILTACKVCPWNYSGIHFNIKGVIRLDFAPLWFFVGLLYEKLLQESKRFSLYRTFYNKHHQSQSQRN